MISPDGDHRDGEHPLRRAAEEDRPAEFHATGGFPLFSIANDRKSFEVLCGDDLIEFGMA